MTSNLLNVSAKRRYAVAGLVELAAREQAAPGSPVRLAELAAARAVPVQFLEQVFAGLRRAGVVLSKRGPAGGYLLARPADRVTVLEIVLALDGASSLPSCTGGGCDPLETQGATSVWSEAQRVFEGVLARTSVALLLEREQRALKNVMYHI